MSSGRIFLKKLFRKCSFRKTQRPEHTHRAFGHGGCRRTNLREGIGEMAAAVIMAARRHQHRQDTEPESVVLRL